MADSEVIHFTKYNLYGVPICIVASCAFLASQKRSLLDEPSCINEEELHQSMPIKYVQFVKNIDKWKEGRENEILNKYILIRNMRHPAPTIFQLKDSNVLYVQVSSLENEVYERLLSVKEVLLLGQDINLKSRAWTDVFKMIQVGCVVKKDQITNMEMKYINKTLEVAKCHMTNELQRKIKGAFITNYPIDQNSMYLKPLKTPTGVTGVGYGFISCKDIYKGDDDENDCVFTDDSTQQMFTDENDNSEDDNLYFINSNRAMGYINYQDDDDEFEPKIFMIDFNMVDA